MAHQVRAAAARLRGQAAAEGWERHQLVDEISGICQVSLLAAHRHAEGWTLAEAAERLNQLRLTGDGAKTTAQQLSKWEGGQYIPKAGSLDLLCRLYQTRADRLGFGADYRGRNTDTPDPVPNKPDRANHDRAPIYSASTPGGRIEDVMDELDNVRAALGETLSQEAPETAISYLERRVNNYDVAFRVGTSTKAIVEVSKDINAARQLLDKARSPDSTERLLTVAARLSGMLGIALLHLGDPQQADQWMLTAEMAAERTGHRGLRAWVANRQALVPLYYGNRGDALGLANNALALSGSRPTESGVRALTIQARVFAAQGDRAPALTAAGRAEEWYHELSGNDVTDGLLGMRPVQMAGYLGEVYTLLHDTRRAMVQNDLVLDVYEGVAPTPEGCLMPEGCFDYVLTNLSAARSHLTDGETERACVVITSALRRIPEVCCTRTVIQEARKVAMLVPERARSAPEWGDLRDVLAFGSTR